MSIQSENTEFDNGYMEGYLAGRKFAQSECDKMLQAQKEEFLRIIDEVFFVEIEGSVISCSTCLNDIYDKLYKELQNSEHQNQKLKTSDDVGGLAGNQTYSEEIATKVESENAKAVGNNSLSFQNSEHQISEVKDEN